MCLQFYMVNDLKCYSQAYKEICSLRYASFFISRTGPYIAGHVAFIFKLNCKQVYCALKISLIIICVFHYIIIKHRLSTTYGEMCGPKL